MPMLHFGMNKCLERERCNMDREEYLVEIYTDSKSEFISEFSEHEIKAIKRFISKLEKCNNPSLPSIRLSKLDE